MKDGKESGPHFSQVVAPVLAAFTLPTIALIVTSDPMLHWRNIILSLFVASTGLLLASFQLAVGSLFRDTPGWGGVRAFLAGLGLLFLGAGLFLLVWPWEGGANQAFLYVGLAFLAAGIAVPVLMTIRIFLGEHLKELRWMLPSETKRIVNLRENFDEAKQEFSKQNTLPGYADLIVSNRIRMLALMQEYSTAGDIDSILDSICKSESAFEQNQALRAAIKLLPELGDSDRKRLSVAVQLLSALDD